MIRLLIIALALLFTVATAEATVPFWFQPKDEPMPIQSYLGFHSAEAFLRWMGCNATIVMWNVPGINAGYSASQNKIVILQGLIDFFHGDDEKLSAVVAHEAGHCLQYTHRDWRSYPLGTLKEWEFDAEAHAHKILRVLGRDADGILLGMRLDFAHSMNRDPHEESWSHGSAYSIWEWARDHDGLGKESIQAPWASP